jgi:uncharacterized membrane protein YagU involved in acid resistance
MTTGRYAWLGFWGGMLGGVFMAMVEMANNLIMGHSIFTPVLMIAAPVLGQQPMMNAMKGGTFYIELIPAIAGMMGHFMWAGLIFGTIFGLIAAWTRLVGRPALWWGLLYGIVAGFFISLVVNPLFGLMPLWQSDGWTAFALMHLGYGLGPGLVLWLGTRSVAGSMVTRQQHAA